MREMFQFSQVAESNSKEDKQNNEKDESEELSSFNKNNMQP
jgi:hypothetical protein